MRMEVEELLKKGTSGVRRAVQARWKSDRVVRGVLRVVKVSTDSNIVQTATCCCRGREATGKHT